MQSKPRMPSKPRTNSRSRHAPSQAPLSTAVEAEDDAAITTSCSEMVTAASPSPFLSAMALSPVKTRMRDDEGTYCFMKSGFELFFDHYNKMLVQAVPDHCVEMLWRCIKDTLVEWGEMQISVQTTETGRVTWSRRLESAIAQRTRTNFEQKIYDGMTGQDLAHDYAHSLRRKWIGMGMVNAELVLCKLEEFEKENVKIWWGWISYAYAPVDCCVEEKKRRRRR